MKNIFLLFSLAIAACVNAHAAGPNTEQIVSIGAILVAGIAVFFIGLATGYSIRNKTLRRWLYGPSTIPVLTQEQRKALESLTLMQCKAQVLNPRKHF